MIAIDTNVLVRALANDDPEQTPRAQALIRANIVYVATTVLLETEWVLRSRHKFPRADIGAVLAAFAATPAVRLEHPDRVARALADFAAGLDFADALHLAAADGCEAFATFDAALRRSARGVVPTREP